MQLTDYARLFRRYWVGILLITLFGAFVAYGWTFTQTKVYQADSSGIVTVVSANDVGSQSVANSIATSKAVTYVGVGDSRAVAQIVIDDLGLKTSPESLVSKITVSSVKDTPTLKVTAQAATAEGATALADAWVAGMAKQISTLEAASDPEAVTTPNAPGTVSLTAIESAVVPTSPIFPNVKLSVLVGAIAGLILGIVYAVVRSQLDRRIRTVDAVERQFGLSVIGTLPVDKRLTDANRIVPEADSTDYSGQSGHHALPEALRELRTNLQFMDVDNPPRIIVVTSPLPNDGKSTVTANLAVTLAAAGQKIIVVDGDLRKPSVTQAFGIVPGVGITDLLIGKAEIQDVLQPWGVSGNLLILGAGSIPPNPSELLGSQGMNVLLHELARDAIVLVDAPPLLPVTDAAVLAARTDGAIVVVSAGKTTTDELQKALTNISKTNGRTLGIILNKVPTKGALGRGYGYYYGSYYGKKSDSKHRSDEPVTADAADEATNVVPFRTGT